MCTPPLGTGTGHRQFSELLVGLLHRYPHTVVLTSHWGADREVCTTVGDGEVCTAVGDVRGLSKVGKRFDLNFMPHWLASVARWLRGCPSCRLPRSRHKHRASHPQHPDKRRGSGAQGHSLVSQLQQSIPVCRTEMTRLHTKRKLRDLPII